MSIDEFENVFKTVRQAFGCCTSDDERIELLSRLRNWFCLECGHSYTYKEMDIGHHCSCWNDE